MHTCSNDCDSFISQTSQPTSIVSTSILVVPPAGVKAMAFEVFNTFNARQLRPVQWSCSWDNESCFDIIVPACLDGPKPRFFVPSQFMSFGLEESPLVESPSTADHLGVLEKLLGSGVLLSRHVAEFF